LSGAKSVDTNGDKFSLISRLKMLNDLFPNLSKNRHRALQVETPQRIACGDFHGKIKQTLVFLNHFPPSSAPRMRAGQSHFLVWLWHQGCYCKKEVRLLQAICEQSRNHCNPPVASFTPH
jgi:hypothetical protein